VAAELVESFAGEEESWPAMAVDIVKKMKEIKRCDIMGFLSWGCLGRCWKSVGKIRPLRQALEQSICRILTD
jgi:hypothetical protein